MRNQQSKLKEGYKQTEVGVIPNDWEVKKLNTICDVRDGTHESPKYLDDGITFITSKNIINGKIDFSDVTFISKNDAININKRSKVNKGDILMSMIGTIGNSVLIDFEPDFCIKNVALFKPQKVLGIFFIQLLYSPFYQTYINSKLDGGIQKFISLGVMREFDVPLPPTKAEQTAIATTLSDADALIQSLEKLIAKKRSIKQGAMQELLKPKEGWVMKRLGEIGTVTGAGVDKKIYDGEVPVRLVNYLDVFHRDFIYSFELNHWVTAPVFKAQKCAVQKGDIFFTPSSEMRFDIAISAVAMEDIPDATYSYHVVRLRLFDDWDLAFRTYIFKTKYFLDQAETICEGSGKRYVISLAKFREMNICFPSDKTEQTRIATIFSDMDAEIAALETKLAKYKQIKQGMMQELLTGRTRLV
jgi:type I restriction enzyme S subunit